MTVCLQSRHRVFGSVCTHLTLPSAKYVKHTTRSKLSERAFSCAGPAAWNALPASLHDITDTSTLKKIT